VSREPNSHRTLCQIAAKWLLKNGCDIVSWELAYNDGFVDAIGLSHPKKEKGKIAAIEVKRTRSDLLADIGRGKFLKYEHGSTHCYIAGTPQALGWKKGEEKALLKDLTERGVPAYWGILLLPPHGWRKPKVLRPARSFGKIIPGLQVDLAIRIASSFAHRLLSKSSPLEE
jgi:Holliday junction resolvase-like predicted endonuclease